MNMGNLSHFLAKNIPDILTRNDIECKISEFNRLTHRKISLNKEIQEIEKNISKITDEIDVILNKLLTDKEIEANDRVYIESFILNNA
jgi:hypothetical protein